MHVRNSSNIVIEDSLLIDRILVPLMIIGIATLTGIVYTSAAEAVQVERYWTVLQAYDWSPTDTYANGFIGVKFREDFKQLVYNVNVNNVDNITGIYLYSRSNGNEEPRIILDLLKEAKEVKVKDKYEETRSLLTKKHAIEGTVAVGGVTSNDLRGDLKGKSLKDLHKMLVKGGTLVVVNTKEFPGGEIGGGDFAPIDRFFPDMSDFNWHS
jgi:CHRD domain